jgi:hypothetical protein
VTHTSTAKPPTIKTGTTAAPQIATTAAQAEHGSPTFTGCDGDWGVSPRGKLD